MRRAIRGQTEESRYGLDVGGRCGVAGGTVGATVGIGVGRAGIFTGMSRCHDGWCPPPLVLTFCSAPPVMRTMYTSVV